MSSSSSVQWMSLIGAIWLQTINGANTDFPVYSSALKELKGISQVGINLLAFASDAGKIFGWVSGVAALYLPLWLVAAIGAVFGLVGYGLQFLLLGQPSFAYRHIFLLTALAGNGICWINTACYLVCVENFAAADTRIAIGLSTSYIGLSAKVYTAVAGAVFGGDHHERMDKEYLLLNAVVPVLAAAAVSPFLRSIPGHKKPRPSRRGFISMFVITAATGVAAVAGSFVSGSKVLLVTILGLLLASPVAIPVAVKFGAALEENRVRDVVAEDDVEAGEEEAEDRVEEKEEAETEESKDVGGLQMLRKGDFWLYFFSYMFSATLGMVFLNNLGQIAESRGLRPNETSSLVSISSSFGFFGRLLPFLLDYYSSRKNCMVSRAAAMATLMAPMAGAFFLLLERSRRSLYASTAAIGAFTGAITSIAVSATTELFGTKRFSVNHNIVITNIPIGSLVFGYLAALLYQLQGGGGSTGGGRGRPRSCVGFVCYEKTFLASGVVCSTGCLLCVVLYVRTRKKVV